MKIWLPVLLVVGLAVGVVIGLQQAGGTAPQPPTKPTTGQSPDGTTESPATGSPAVVAGADPTAAPAGTPTTAPATPDGTAPTAAPAEGETPPVTGPHISPDPETGATRYAFPRAWPTAGSLVWEVVSNHEGDERRHTINADWAIADDQTITLKAGRHNNQALPDPLTIGRYRGVLQITDPEVTDKVVRHLVRDASRLLLAQHVDLPTQVQEAGADYLIGGTRFELAVTAEGASFLRKDDEAGEGGDDLKVSASPEGRRTTRTVTTIDEGLRVQQRLTVLYR